MGGCGMSHGKDPISVVVPREMGEVHGMGALNAPAAATAQRARVNRKSSTLPTRRASRGPVGKEKLSNMRDKDDWRLSRDEVFTIAGLRPSRKADSFI